MFRSLTKQLYKTEQHWTGSQKIEHQAIREVENFLSTRFRGLEQKFLLRVDYRAQDSVLLLETKTKSFSQELQVCSSLLKDHLLARNIKIRQLIVR